MQIYMFFKVTYSDGSTWVAGDRKRLITLELQMAT